MTNETYINSMHKYLNNNCSISLSESIDFNFTVDEKEQIKYWVGRYARHFSRFGSLEPMPEELHIVSLSKRLKIDFGICHIPEPNHLISIYKGASRKYGYSSYNP